MLRDVLQRNQILVVLAVGTYLGAWLLGLVLSWSVPLGEQSVKTAIEPGFDRVLYVLKNNAIAWLYLVSGVVTAGFTTFVALGINGFWHSIVVAAQEMSFARSLVLLAPHGIFEVPGLILAGAVGFKSAAVVYSHVRRERELIVSDTELRDTAFLLVTSFALIVVGAVVEGLLTPRLTTAIG